MKQAVLVLVLCLFCVAIKAQEKVEVVSFFAPEKYPAAALAVRAWGEVLVDIVIDSSGQVISATPVKGHPLLRAISEQAALKWQFSKVSDKAKKTNIQLVFDFKIDRKTIEESEKEAEAITRNNRPSPFRVEVISETLVPKLLLLPREFGEIKPEVCEVHSQLMQVEIQKRSCGEVSSNDSSFDEEDAENFYEIRAELFPNANIKPFSSCGTDQIERREIHFCHICRIKHEEWLQENR